MTKRKSNGKGKGKSKFDPRSIPPKKAPGDLELEAQPIEASPQKLTEEEFNALAGPELRFKYDTPERGNLYLRATKGFGPAVLAVLDDEFDAHPRLIPFGMLNVGQMELIEKHLERKRLEVLFELGAAQMKKERRSGIARLEDLEPAPSVV